MQLTYKPPDPLRGFHLREGAVHLRRCHLAYAGDHKREYLLLHWVEEATRALPRPGKFGEFTERRSQAFLGACCGVSRESMNAWVGLFSEPDGRWNDERRRQQSARMHQRHGTQPDSAELEPIPRVATLLNKTGGLGISLRYSHFLPSACAECRNAGIAECGHVFDPWPGTERRMCPECAAANAKECPHWKRIDAERLAFIYGADIFNPEAIGVNGDQKVLACLFDPHHPDAQPCLCALGQMKLAFQEVCPHCGPCPTCKGTREDPKAKAEGKAKPCQACLQKCELCGGKGKTGAGVKCAGCNGKGKASSGNRGYMIGFKYSAEGKWVPSYLGPGPRALGCYLQMRGIRKKGFIQRIQSEMAAEMGIDPGTFYRDRQVLEWLGYLKVVPGDIIRDCLKCGETFAGSEFCPCGGTGPVKDKKPDKLIWLPDLLLNSDIVAAEWERFQAAAGSLLKHLDARGQKHLASLRDKAKDLLAAWKGKQHNLMAYYNQIRADAKAAGIPPPIIDHCFHLQT